MENKSQFTCLTAAQEAEKCCNEGNLAKGVELLEKAIEIGTDDLFLLSAIYSQLGNAYYSMRMYNKALSLHLNDFYISRVTNDLHWSSKSLANLAMTTTALQRYDDAKEFAKNFLSLAKQLKDKKLEGRGFYLLGHVYMCKVRTAGCSQPLKDGSPLNEEIVHDLNHAIECFKRNVVISEEMEDAQTSGFLYGNLGNAFYYLGNFTQSYDYHQKRLKIAREVGDKAVMKKAYINLGNNCVFLSRFDEAMVYYKLALEIARESSNKYDEAQAEYYLGQTAAFKHDYISAIESHSRHLKLARELGDIAGEIRANWNLANDFLAQDDLPKSLYYLVRNYSLSIDMNDETLKKSVMKQISDMALRSPNSILSNNEILVDSSYDPDFATTSPDGITTVNIVDHPTTSNFSSGITSSLSETSSSPAEIPHELRDLIFESINQESSANSINQNVSNPDCGLVRTSLQPQIADVDSIEGRDDEGMFEMITRAQSKRIDDQRCDPAILKDSKNTKFSIERQTDSISPQRQHGTFCRLKRKVSRRLSNFGLIRPRTPQDNAPRTSTPKEKPKAKTPSLKRFFSFKKKNSSGPPKFGDFFDETLETTQDASGGLASSGMLNSINERSSRLSLDENPSCTYSPDAILDLIMNIQSRRMDDQRAELLLPGLQQAAREEILGKLTEARRAASHESLIDERLYNLILEYQSNRIEDQRSPLGTTITESNAEAKPTIPETEISEIINRQQIGRIDSQRANPPTPTKKAELPGSLPDV